MAKASSSSPAPKSPSKTEVFNNITEATGLTRKQVQSVFDALNDEIKKAIGKGGPGVFNIPGLAKITVQHKPAQKARMGVDPFTKEERMFKAKPATTVVKLRPLKGLKDLA